jgi:hypothetical protein
MTIAAFCGRLAGEKQGYQHHRRDECAQHQHAVGARRRDRGH